MKTNHTNEQLQAAALSQLRPLAEAGEVPEGCVRYYTYKKDGEWTPATKHRAMQDTHYIDIRLPESEPMSTKPISLPLAECMSLRDYFAGQALAGSLASQTPESYWAFVSSGSAANDSAKNGIAKLCYDLADAMLAAREVKP